MTGRARCFARTVWNGPFHVGPLTKPVSLGDVLAKLLETGWRTLLVFVALFALGLLLLWTISIWEARLGEKPATVGMDQAPVANEPWTDFKTDAPAEPAKTDDLSQWTDEELVAEGVRRGSMTPEQADEAASGWRTVQPR